MGRSVSLLPMHGECKMRTEGLRTRDGHFLDWFCRLTDWEITVVSRAEPWPRVSMGRRRPLPDHVAQRVRLTAPQVLRGPATLMGDRRRWWADAVRWQPRIDPDATVIAWNPFAAEQAIATGHRGQLHFDLLDDWSIHPSFSAITDQVEHAYGVVFEHAGHVTANAEGTAELANRFGRTDVELLPNGVDPQRFEGESTARGTASLVGYAGKLSHRLDLDLVRSAAEALPECMFEFAGPVIDRSVRHALSGKANIRLLGDVHYADYPQLLSGWDIGWVPHRVNSGEVGGDVIKTYEYRAAGLPTVSTPIVGATRLEGVRVAAAGDIPNILKDLASTPAAPRVAREPGTIPAIHTWEHKARRLVALVDEAAA